MAVLWDWKNKAGTFTYREFNYHDGTPYHEYTLSLYKGSNCLAVLLYEYKDQDTGKNMYQFMAFFNDLAHLKRCVQDETFSMMQHVRKIKIDVSIMGDDAYKIAKLFLLNTPAKIYLYNKEKKDVHDTTK